MSSKAIVRITYPRDETIRIQGRCVLLLDDAKDDDTWRQNLDREKIVSYPTNHLKKNPAHPTDTQ